MELPRRSRLIPLMSQWSVSEMRRCQEVGGPAVIADHDEAILRLRTEIRRLGAGGESSDVFVGLALAIQIAIAHSENGALLISLLRTAGLLAEGVGRPRVVLVHAPLERLLVLAGLQQLRCFLRLTERELEQSERGMQDAISVTELEPFGDVGTTALLEPSHRLERRNMAERVNAPPATSHAFGDRELLFGGRQPGKNAPGTELDGHEIHERTEK